MVKGIGLRKVEITEEEFAYYKEIINRHAADCFNDLFETDKNGKITLITPTKNVPWEVLFFVQNLMINQWLRSYDERIEKIERKIK